MAVGRWCLVVALVLTQVGCGSSAGTAGDPGPEVDDLAVHARGTCPDVLPVGKDSSGHGFGIDEPATEVPSLAEPDGAWICEYVADGPGRVGPGSTTYQWTSSGPPVEVGDRLPELAEGLSGLALLSGERACTAELGSRWLVSTTHDTDVTGVVVDGYGCGDARLTDDPFASPPGEAAAPGVVPGVLSAPASLRRTIQAVVGDRARWVDLTDADAAMRLPCPEDEQRGTDLDIPGPGVLDPETAVRPYADDGRVVMSDAATGGDGYVLVNALDDDGVVVRVFRVTDRDDGWWPDGYLECG